MAVVLAMIFATSGFTALVSTLLIRTRAFTAAEQLLLRPGARSPFARKGERRARLGLPVRLAVV